jgi:hypothetical protein
MLLKTRNVLLSRLLSDDGAIASLDAKERDFLTHYLQFTPDTSNTHIFYPVGKTEEWLWFQRETIAGNMESAAIQRLLSSSIIGMMFFHAELNSDMSFTDSEELQVILFLENNLLNAPCPATVESCPQGFHYVDSSTRYPSPKLQAIMEKYAQHIEAKI